MPSSGRSSQSRDQTRVACQCRFFTDAWRDWGKEEKGMIEDEMAGWRH